MTYSLSNGTKTVKLQANGDATYGSPQIENMKTTKENPTWEIMIPTNDANSTVVIDLLGTKRSITLTGNVQGSVTNVNNFINDMESFVNSNQYLLSANGLIFAFDFPYTTSPGDKSYTVIMKSFDWEYNKGVPGQATWTCQLVQGNS